MRIGIYDHTTTDDAYGSLARSIREQKERFHPEFEIEYAAQLTENSDVFDLILIHSNDICIWETVIRSASGG